MTSGPRAIAKWRLLVAACAGLLVVAGIVLAVWSAVSTQERLVSYSVRGSLAGVTLDVGAADVEVVGGGRAPAVAVSHVDRFGFGHGPTVARSVVDGMFAIRSRCPKTILHGCSVRYRLVVPDNVPVVVTTTSGSVLLRDYRGSARIVTGRGGIDVTGFCGFSLEARSEAGGNVAAATSCPPQQLTLRATTGTVRAVVPGGRYRVDASTSRGAPAIHGVTPDAGAPFAIQALSGSGAVSVEGGGS
jgi:hypothetical protein